MSARRRSLRNHLRGSRCRLGSADSRRKLFRRFRLCLHLRALIASGFRKHGDRVGSHQVSTEGLGRSRDRSSHECPQTKSAEPLAWESMPSGLGGLVAQAVPQIPALPPSAGTHCIWNSDDACSRQTESEINECPQTKSAEPLARESMPSGLGGLVTQAAPQIPALPPSAGTHCQRTPTFRLRGSVIKRRSTATTPADFDHSASGARAPSPASGPSVSSRSLRPLSAIES